jgi:hypothetical protein
MPTPSIADHREPDEQPAPCAEDGRTLAYDEPAASEPAQVLVREIRQRLRVVSPRGVR